MHSSPTQFKNQLKKSVNLIRARKQWSLSSIRDHLGYAAGKKGGSFIHYLLRDNGNVPAELDVLEKLAGEIFQSDGFDNQKELEQFLHYGGHPQSATKAMLLAQQCQSIQPPELSKNHSRINNSEQQNQRVFIAGNIFQDLRQFFGRERELRSIFAKVNAMPMQHIYVEGPKGSGKTWLLQYLSRITIASPASLRPNQRTDWLPSPEQYRWVRINFEDPINRSEKNLLLRLLRKLDIPIPDPCTLFTFRNALDEHEWLQPTIILMDEVSVGFGSKDISAEFWVTLRSLISDDVAKGNLAYILAGHKPLQELADHYSQASPVGNIYLTQKLSRFTEADTQALIDSSPIKFSATDSKWILKTSRRWPVLLQILCGELLENLENQDFSEQWKSDGLEKVKQYSWLLTDDE